MEKKTKFKLHYIHSHVKKSRIIRKPNSTLKASEKSIKKKEENESHSFLLLKFYSPFTVIRTVGDFAYLDQSSSFEEYVKFSALNLHFKTIKEIKSSANFTVCTLHDSDEPYMDIQYLSQRLMSLNDQNSYNLACNIARYAHKHESVDISGKRDFPSITEKAFYTILDENANDPMILYHYKPDKNFGYLIHKMGVNKCLQNLTKMNDLDVFQEGPLVIPGKDYFYFMSQHIDFLFGEANQLFNFYVQTPDGILKLHGHLYQVKLSDENVVIIVLKKSIQEPGVKLRLDQILEMKLEEDEKIAKNGHRKNVNEWDRIIKKYYAPWIFKEGNKRCGYKNLEMNEEK